MDGGGGLSEEKQENALHQLHAELQEIDEQTDELLRQQDVWRNELTILKAKKELLTDEEEIQRIDDRIADIERQLDRWEHERTGLLKQRNVLISEQNALERLESESLLGDELKDIAKNAAKKVITAPVAMTVQTVKSGVKSAISKANPFDQKINQKDVTDSGVESIRLAYTSVKKAKSSIKTVSNTVKTTQRTIKTAGKAAKTTAKIAYRTPIFVVKTAVKTVRMTATIAANVVAALMNPVAIVIIAMLFLFLFLLMGISAIIFGGDTADKSAVIGAVGLVEVDEQYQAALAYFDAAIQSRKDAYYALIDSLYYNYEDLTHSDLAYLERINAEGNKTTYQTSFATGTRKDALKAAWNFTEEDMHGIIAVAYVYLEKLENEAHGTEGGIYEVTYTQEVFDLIAEKCVNFNDTVYAGQSCGTGCTRHVEVQHNPEYDSAAAEVEHFLNAYTEWVDVLIPLLTTYNTIKDGTAQTAYWNNMIQWRIDNWKLVYFDSCYYSNSGWDYADDIYSWYINSYNYMITVPQDIEEVTYICEYQHNLHSIGLWYYSKESIMDALNFTDNEKEWVSLTEMGFESNPDIP